MKKILFLILGLFILANAQDYRPTAFNITPSTGQFTSDDDTLKIDMGGQLYLFDLEVGDSRLFGIDSVGNVSIASTGEALSVTIASTGAGGYRGVDIQPSHGTDALTGTIEGGYFSARVNIDSPSGSVNGITAKAG